MTAHEIPLAKRRHRKRCIAILSLMRRLPPDQLRVNLGRILKLLMACEPQHYGTIFEYILSVVDHPLQWRNDPKDHHHRPFVLCEYNRDGDLYRSPWTNEYVPAVEGDADDLVEPVVGGPACELLRMLEVVANPIFSEYARLYYDGIQNESSGVQPVISSVYAWPIDESQDGDGPAPEALHSFAMCVAFLKDAACVCGTWNSIHIVRVRDAGDFDALSGRSKTDTLPCIPSPHYEVTSTVLLFLKARPAEDEVFRLGGNQTRSMTTANYKGTSKEIRCRRSFIEVHIANIGDLIQRHENELYAQLHQIYFGKAEIVSQKLRAIGLYTRPDGSALRDTTKETVSSKGKTKNKKKATSMWETAEDEEGNIYYYHTETGETSWEPPSE